MGWREELVENRAVIIQRGWTPLGEEFIYRQFPAISVKAKDACVVGLKTYASTKNSGAGSFVVDPLVDDEKQVGTWYGGEIIVKYDTPDQQNQRAANVVVLVQMLIKGLAAAVKAAVVVERTCRWVVERTEFRSMIAFPTLPAPAAGVNYRFVDGRLDDKTGLWSGYLETRTRQAQSIAEYTSQIDAFGNTKKSESLGISDVAAAALIPSSQTPGELVKVDLARNEDCTLDLEKTKRTGAPGTRRTTTTERGDVTVVETELENQAAAATPHAAEVGKIHATADTLNDLKLHDHNVRVETAKDQSIDMPATYTAQGNAVRTLNQVSRTAIFENAAVAPTPLLTGEFGAVSYSRNQFDLYTGYKTLVEYLIEPEIAGWAVTKTVFDLNYWDRVQRGKKMYRRPISYSCVIEQLSSRVSAYNHAYDERSIDGTTYYALQGTEVGSSRVEVLRNGQYRAIWIGNRRLGAWVADGDDLPI